MSEAEETRFRHDLAALLPRVRRFALALTGAVADADDLTQAALERALVRQRQFTPGTRLDSWVFRIAQNLWIDQMRSRARDRRLITVPIGVSSMSAAS